MSNKEKINSFLYTLFGFQKTKGRIHLIAIICVHIICWLIFLLLPLLFFPVRFQNEPLWQRELIQKILPISLFYFNYYLLLPRLFEKKKFTRYVLAIVVSLFFILVTDVAVRSRLSGIFGPPAIAIPSEFSSIRIDPRPADTPRLLLFNGRLPTDSLRPLFPARPFFEKRIFGLDQSLVFFSFNRTISTCIFLLLLGGLIRLAYSFLKNQNEKKTLENVNLNAEVNFLKSQINPHFLFNTLNSIYSQAHSRSVNTEFSILKLSELLRYVLYDSSTDKVDLSKDIQYINNYIDLQRLRLSPKVTLHYTISGDSVEGKVIAPLLLISFIENAFKHGISYTKASVITITISVFEETLTLSVTNPIVEKDSFAPGGLGLKNVTRRLELLYPGQYLLDIHRINDLHIVNLKIKLTGA